MGMETKKHRTDCLRAEVKSMILGLVKANVSLHRNKLADNPVLEIKNANYRKNDIQIWLDKDENGFDMLMIKENGVVKTNKTYFSRYQLVGESLRIIAQNLEGEADFFGHLSDTQERDERSWTGINIAKKLNENSDYFCWNVEYTRVVRTIQNYLGWMLGREGMSKEDWDYLKLG